MKNKLLSLIDSFEGKNILVIGDIMLDKYIFGDVSRISPEAPVQVVEVSKEEFSPGGASNVASNVASLAGQAAMVGVIGKDASGVKLLEVLEKQRIQTKGIVVHTEKPTTQKVRIIGQNQQLLRVDYEEKGYISGEIEEKLLAFVQDTIQEVDAIIISDYAKGVITKSFMVKLKDIAEETIIVVDPKPAHIAFYKYVTLVAPNLKEAREMVHKPEEHDIRIIGQEILGRVNGNVLITMGEKGMVLFEKESRVTEIPTKAKEVFDVSGAGDTVVATITMALAAGADLIEAALLANHAAGIVVGKVGTSTLTLEELKKDIEHEYQKQD